MLASLFSQFSSPYSSQWTPFAEQAIATIYRLSEQPDRVCGIILRALVRKMSERREEGGEDGEREGRDGEREGEEEEEEGREEGGGGKEREAERGRGRDEFELSKGDD